MSIKNVYEVFEDFKRADSKKDRIDVLRKYDSYALRNVLIGTFDPRAKFTITKIPQYKSEEVPPGMSYNNMTQVLDKMYLFAENHPKKPAGLTDERRDQLLVQILESLEAKEAEVYANTILKDQKVPYLTVNLVNEAFPGLIPIHE